ncbi:hypothetical protein GF326_05040 [Candidatus Bathyarchaeota archaeon]|jgi:hypothetical protein|nr:hypothetical protein [Candidatus Bathyarchaeota archaeon]
MSADMNVETAKEMIIEELEGLEEENKKPVVKFKDIYQENKEWSPIFFKAGRELDMMNEDIEMSIRYGFHQVEKTN